MTNVRTISCNTPRMKIPIWYRKGFGETTIINEECGEILEFIALAFELGRRCSDEDISQKRLEYEDGFGLYLNSRCQDKKEKSDEELFNEVNEKTPRNLEGNEYARALYGVLDRTRKYSEIREKMLRKRKFEK